MLQVTHVGRLKVNMGNIYYKQKKFPLAVKMYRMALDQTPSAYKETRYRILRNIGNAFMRLGQYQVLFLSCLFCRHCLSLSFRLSEKHITIFAINRFCCSLCFLSPFKEGQSPV
jgi:hypothetical protein